MKDHEDIEVTEASILREKVEEAGSLQPRDMKA